MNEKKAQRGDIKKEILASEVGKKCGQSCFYL